MSDPISRQAAIDAASSLCDDCDSGYCGSCRVNYPGEKDVIKALKDLPSEQPERKMGKWIYNSPTTMKCDRCGFAIKDWDWHRFKYCPNCGADMRGEQDG